MKNYPHKYHHPQHVRRRGCCLGSATLGLLLVVVIGYAVFGSPDILQDAGQQIVGRQLGFQQQLEQQAGRMVPTVIAVMPQGVITLTDVQANAYLSSNPEAIAPVEQIRVQFLPAQIQANLSALGTESRLTAGVAVQNGRLIIIDPQLDGSMSMFISVDDLVQSLEQQVNAQLLVQGRTVRDVYIEQGQIVVFVES